MADQKESFHNHFSFVFGILCFMVVYMHSGWCEGFNIYTWGANSKSIEQLTSLVIRTTVPSFFICWGYLSNKYFYSDEKIYAFLFRKISQFYPFYFICSIISIASQPEIFELPLWKIVLAALGLYWEPYFKGANIYMPVFYVILTATLFKALNIKGGKLICYSIFCMMIAKIMPHASTFGYFRYFGYYAAFWFGVMLKQLDAFEINKRQRNKKVKWIINLMLVSSLVTPVLNYFEIKFTEIQYQPNSPEHLLFCFLVLYITIRTIKTTGIYQKNSIGFNIIHTIGNNAYGHFIAQYYVIQLIIIMSEFFSLNKIIMQILLICLTSLVTVYLIVIPYNRLEIRAKLALKNLVCRRLFNSKI